MSSKSSSSQSSNQTTNNADNRFMAGDGATVAAHGGEVYKDSIIASDRSTINMLDGGAIAGALQLARDVFGAGAQGVQQQAEVFQGYGQQLQTFAAQAINDQGEQLAEVLKWLIGGAVVIGAVMMMRKGARA